MVRVGPVGVRPELIGENARAPIKLALPTGSFRVLSTTVAATSLGLPKLACQAGFVISFCLNRGERDGPSFSAARWHTVAQSAGAAKSGGQAMLRKEDGEGLGGNGAAARRTQQGRAVQPRA